MCHSSKQSIDCLIRYSGAGPYWDGQLIGIALNEL